MAKVLILWNDVEDDVVALWREDGRTAPDWDPSKTIDQWDTVEEEMQLLITVLREGGHEPRVVNVRDDIGRLLAVTAEFAPDCVMNLVEYFRDDIEHEHHVPALFELLELPYTGARPLALTLCQKKPLAKAQLVAAGVPTPRGLLVEVGETLPIDLGLRYPLIVKPAYEDASGGIDSGSVVADREALEARVAKILGEHAMAALVEEYIEGRELHCAILGNDPPVALPLFEMEFRGGDDDDGKPLPHIITYKAKWDPFSRDHHAVEGHCPPRDLDDAVCAHIQAVAMKAYRALGCRDYARVDMRVDPVTGDPFVLEVNPNPDLADGCAFATSVRAAGQTYGWAINQIIGMALARGAASKAASAGRTSGPSDTLLREYLAKRAR
jgi:D-alanine-D-alanine ligase